MEDQIRQTIVAIIVVAALVLTWALFFVSDKLNGE